MSTFDQARIDECRKRCEAATAGPWLWSGPSENWTYWPRFLNGPALQTIIGPDDSRSTESCADLRVEIDPSDQEFIAAARTDLPDALDALEEARRERDEAIKLLRELTPTKCVCSPEYTSRNLHDPQCEYHETEHVREFLRKMEDEE